MPEQSTVSYNIDFLKESAESLAKSQSWTTGEEPYKDLKPELVKARATLTEAYRVLSLAVKKSQDISSAAEWLIDNFYIVQEQIVQVSSDFPKNYQKSIPKLSEGRNRGMPRVYEIALNLVIYTDNLIDEETLTTYVKSYQEQEVLTQGEIWAIPIMIRFVLIEQLVRKAEKVLERRKIRPEVALLVNELVEQEYREPGEILRRIISWMSDSSMEVDEQMVLVEMANMMQSAGLLTEEEKRWFDFRFNQIDLTFDEAMRREARDQSRLQVSIQNSIASLRTISETDWSDFGEECSIMNQMLKLDPMGIYPEMDFQTRDRYRQVIERLSRRSDRTEIEVTEQILLLAESAAEESGSHSDREYGVNRNKERHVGYYLLDRGYERLTKEIGYKMPMIERGRLALEKRTSLYLGTVGLHTLLLLLILWWITDAPDQPAAISVTVLLIAFFPALDLSVAAVNRFFAMILPPRRLPKMNFKESIPEDSRTVVVVPTLLTSPADVKRQLEQLEVRSLANPAEELQFGLLTDFPDADDRRKDLDEKILEVAEALVANMNQKYSCKYGEKFFLFHRERRWNEKEGVWMGWERKRGKLEEFNRLLSDPEAETSYHNLFGSFLHTLENYPVEFAITLDADTRLPPDAARDLVRTASHPLNRATVNPETQRIEQGYGIIQPKISIPPDSSRKTLFSQIFSGNVGLDPYSTVVSDIYQDLKGEAIFTGKGIYDLKAFHHIMENRLPENHILSHDLLESTYMRAGLATEIELFDDFPSTYASYSKRNHRWTRGDWQIASWMLPRAPESSGIRRNPLNLLSKWKVFDNLRRSLTPFFLMVFFLAGWFWLPGSPILWTLAALGILAFPVYVSLSSDVVNRPARVKWKLYLEKIRANLKINTLQTVSILFTLPHQAYLHLDAVFRVFWRMMVSRQNLLEWTTASHTEDRVENSFSSYLAMTWWSPLVGLAVLSASLIFTPKHWGITVPFALLWIGTPYYVWRISQPLPPKKDPFTARQRWMLRSWARRTWFYFERFAGEEHSWLPPDNYQEEPNLSAVARTSPTNIGLALVSIKVAYNFGYITFSEMLDRVEKTLHSLQMLETYRGHFYNWYDTRFGEALSPKYVSTVDSGNLAAGLLVIKEAVQEELKTEGINRYSWRGLQDTTRALEEVFLDFREQEIASDELIARVQLYTGTILNQLRKDWPQTVSGSLEKLRLLKESALELCRTDLMPLGNQLGDEQMRHLLYWIEAPLVQIESLIAEWKSFGELDIQTGFHTVEEIERMASQTGKGQAAVSLIRDWKRQVAHIVSVSERLVENMDFSFLYNPKRGLFTIGYNTEKAEADSSTYDLLASEARISSYIAIAKGDVPPEHWFRLSRRLTRLGKNEILLSWGGTMFEYLMPMLFMRSFPQTLLSHTYESIIEWQKAYGERNGRPWGASESAYNFLNLEMQYQYRAFGVPGLGLKRGLAEEYVIAPYATLLALMVDPGSAVKNLEQIESYGGLGLMGFFDAIDFTPTRLRKSDTYQVVKTYMAHHHGMSLLALDNVLNNWSIHHLFHSDPQIRSCDLLLQERIPRGMPIKEPHPIDVELEPGEQKKMEYIVEHAGIHQLDRSPPRLHMLSNGRYSLFTTHAGTGCSKFGEVALNGWKADPTSDPLGLFFYIRDKESGEYWSSGHQPVKRRPDRYDTWFHNGRIVTSRVDDWIETTTEICVSSEYPMELRRLTLTNYSDEVRKIEVTSFAEIVLNRLADHNSHPAFSRLFVQTDYIAEHHAILAKRRPRSREEEEQWLIHTVTGPEPDDLTEPLQFETERAAFVGRGRTLKSPAAMDDNQRLSGSQGNVSDPVASLRRTVLIEPGKKTQLVFGLGWASSRDEAIRLADISDNPHAAEREFDLASVYSRVEQEHIGVTAKEGHFFQKLASWILYPVRDFRATDKQLVQNRRQQKGLWAYGISGDLPLVVFRISESGQMKGVDTLLKAMNFWKLKGLAVDLVILNDHPPSYADELQESIHKAMEATPQDRSGDGKGGVFILKSDKIPEEDETLILTVASAVFQGKLPVISVGEEWVETRSFHGPEEKTPYRRQPLLATSSEEEATNLKFFNGYGGFSEDGKEYHILMKPDRKSGRPVIPPAPWINIIANRKMGFITSERGGGYSWSVNSRENKLTTWSNDPVHDPCSEALFIRDEESREFWSPLPGPTPGNGTYRAIHGFGWTSYHHTSGELEQETVCMMAADEPVKITRLRLRNRSDRPRRLSLYSFSDLVMGVDKSPASRMILPRVGEEHRKLFARNHYNNEFAGRIAFHTIAVPGQEAEYSFSTDRETFIGRNMDLSSPAALIYQEKLDNRIATGGDICSAFQSTVDLQAGAEIELIILLGEVDSEQKAEELIDHYSTPDEIRKEQKAVEIHWDKLLSTIQVETPSEALNVMVNGWLMYQNITSRLFARTAFYQAGGAYGFRDQLQDVMAAFYSDPQFTRSQLLLHASRQFPEGDVQHWWHPPTGRGIRSKITDDRLWLPYVADFYLQSTGDVSILDEQIPFVSTRTLREDEHEVYLEPEVTDETANLYEHCCRAIDVSLKMGRHGIPLIGAGDWNDGMNRIGEGGEGESVWLGFFLYDILEKFKKICEKRGDDARAKQYEEEARRLKTRLNEEGWDGEWYLRAFYDDGTPLGSSKNEECKIDAISQAWSVISGVATEERKHQALESLEEHLIMEEDGIIKLLTPAFDQTEKDPGYIGGYIPGVRENGGQYTHGALWTIKAFADAGMGDKAVNYLDMINPVNHALHKEDADIYKVEPYVVAADVYGEIPMRGQGGWTWYTGSGGWMYRIAVESILGVGFEEDLIRVKPRISSSWEQYSLMLKLPGETRYEIVIRNPEGLEHGRLKGGAEDLEVVLTNDCAAIPLKKDGGIHKIDLVIRSKDGRDI